jgi:hypothetical protein
MVRRILVLLTVVTFLGVTGCKGGSSGGGTSTPTTPTPANSAPVITNITINPAFAIQQLGTFAMSATATDANNDTLTYTWDFGDGSSANGATQNKSYTTGGSKNVKLSVTDGKVSTPTSDSRTIDVGSMTGNWKLTTTACAGWANQDFLATLTQNNGIVTGTFTAPKGFCAATAGTGGVTDPAEPGTINSSGYVVIRFKIGAFLDFYFRGTMQTPGNKIVGGVFNSGFGGEATTLDRQ